MNEDPGSSSNNKDKDEENILEDIEDLEVFITDEMFFKLRQRRDRLIGSVYFCSLGLEQLHKDCDVFLSSNREIPKSLRDAFSLHIKIHNKNLIRIQLINNGFRKRFLTTTELEKIFSNP